MRVGMTQTMTRILRAALAPRALLIGALALGAVTTLTPPEVLVPLSNQSAKPAMPVAPEVRSAVEDQVDRFVAALLTEEVQSDSLRAKLDSPFARGREEGSGEGRVL